MSDAKEILIQALNERTTNNPSYSMRAFARDLGISPQQLSNVINGHRGFAPKAADEVANKLSLSEHEKEIFLQSLKASFARSETQKSIARSKLKSLKVSSGVKNLQLDLFKVISSWHHFAIIELIKISKKKPAFSWYAKKLNIPVKEVELAFERLEKLELIKKTDTYWEANQDVVIADQGIPSEAIRNYHRLILEKANQALTFQTSEERYGSSSTIPIKVKNLARAKKLIQDFRLAFDSEISNSQDGEEIYALSVQFFRLTEK